MKALVFNGNIVQISSTDFTVSPEMVWVDSPDNATVETHYFDGSGVVPKPVVAPTIDEVIDSYTSALDNHIDATAQLDKWDNRITCVLRAGYPNPWQANGIAFGEWMDTCYTLAYQIMYDIQAQNRTMPSISDFLAEMPTMVWPS